MLVCLKGLILVCLKAAYCACGGTLTIFMLRFLVLGDSGNSWIFCHDLLVGSHGSIPVFNSWQDRVCVNARLLRSTVPAVLAHPPWGWLPSPQRVSVTPSTPRWSLPTSHKSLFILSGSIWGHEWPPCVDIRIHGYMNITDTMYINYVSTVSFQEEDVVEVNWGGQGKWRRSLRCLSDTCKQTVFVGYIQADSVKVNAT